MTKQNSETLSLSFCASTATKFIFNPMITIACRTPLLKKIVRETLTGKEGVNKTWESCNIEYQPDTLDFAF